MRYRIILEEAMTLSRRKTLSIIGGGVILAATASLGAIASRQPRTATLPWGLAGQGEDVRRRALSYALLAPNPHNRQPWRVDLREAGVATLHVDTERLLPHTDPFSRQITIGLGCFLELMRIAASHDGQRVTITPFPEGFDDTALDARPVARAVFTADATVTPDPLFAFVLARRSNKEPYDTARKVPQAAVEALGVSVTQGSRFGATLAVDRIALLRDLTHEALVTEFTTARTMQESVDLFRIGAREVDANPDGLDFSGPMFEVMGATGLFSREASADPTSFASRSALTIVEATAKSAMGYVWLTTPGNSRPEQLAAGADWLRLNLAVTGEGLGMQPMSQALQEFPEMAEHYARAHGLLAPEGGTVQMLGRVGYGPEVGQSPRWPVEAIIL
jgi:hypothetical protein